MTPTEEIPSRIEPYLPDETSPEILDLVAALSAATNSLGARLHPRSAAALAESVRIMNCYYSNLIEGHNTTPREIERAMANQLDALPERRNLQVEARAHIRVQRDVDRRHAAGQLPEPRIGGIHRLAASGFLRGRARGDVAGRGGGRQIRMIPGTFRSSSDHEVMVGRHWSPAGPRVAVFRGSWPWRRCITA